MADEKATLRINAERLGTVEQVVSFLTDFDDAYNNLYFFDFIVKTLSADRDRFLDQFEERYKYQQEYLRNPDYRKDLPSSYFFYKHFIDDLFYFKLSDARPNLLEFQSKINIQSIILPEDKLVLAKINIQSPGFWEFLGKMGPIQQLRLLIKDIWYENTQEKKLGELKIVEKEIELLKKIGYSDSEIRQFATNRVINPVKKLEQYKDRGQIEEPD